MVAGFLLLFTHTWGFSIGDTMNDTKICTKCQEEKPATIEFFFKASRQKNGLRSPCKACTKEQRLIYREENKDALNKKNSDYYFRNKDKIIAYQKVYKQTDTYRCAKRRYDKIYLQNNLAKHADNNAKRRAKKLDQTPDYANLDLISRIYTHCPEGYAVDHMTPLSRGGFHHESNLCYLPSNINCSKWAKTIEEFGTQKFNKHVIYWQDVL